MLKSQDAENAPQSSASLPRVTPEELSQALAAIEARRQAEASRIAGTIPIDQAVSELHLDSTSEEIWAEVQARRDRAAAAQHEQVQQAQAAQQAREAQQTREAQHAQQRLILPHAERRRGWTGFLAPLVFVWALFYAGVIPHHFGGHSAHIAAPILRHLAQVPDGKEVYADDSALVQVSEGKPLAQITVSENATGNRWTLVKIGPHVYLRGYIASTDSLQPLGGKALNVYNDDDSGELHHETTSNITLRVDNIPLQKSGGDDGFSAITVPNFQPDPLTTLTPWH